MSDTITCPNCQTEIEISEALSAQLKADLRRQFDQKRKASELEIAKREDLLKSRIKKVETAEKSIDEKVEARLATERHELFKKATEKAKETVAVELQDQAAELTSAKQKLKAAQEAELELRKKTRELDEQKQEMELTLTRKLDTEREKIRKDAKDEAASERELKDAEKEKVIGDLRKTIAELQRKSEQGSQQLQGEVMELSLEEQLQRLFPMDSIAPVPKGIHGGDVIHGVHDGTQGICGTIVWESKRTKSWSDGWLPKLRDDQRAAKAQLAILVTVELPNGIKSFGQIDGVWVCGWHYALPLASVLRSSLIQLSGANRAQEGRQDKMEFLYQYLAGSEFKNRVEGIVESFATLQDELEKERRAMERIWSKRDKQLKRAVTQTAGMYGDLQGIVGASLPQIARLELEVDHDKSEGDTEASEAENE